MSANNSHSTSKEDQPDPRIIARQLRKPAGEAAKSIAEKMDWVNEPLFDLTLDSMELGKGDSVLGIGFGSGSFFSKIFSRAEHLNVAGVDYSQEMIELAKRQNKDYLNSGHLVLKSGSSDDLPFDDATFDKVFCNMVIYFWDHPSSHIREVFRVLKAGGHFYTGIRTKESMLKFPFVKHGFTLYDPKKWSSILKQHGFKIADIQKQLDPRIIQEEPEIQLESVCIAAQKKGN
jgi:ubiquinone/menaquinone biosynthesis C-methylase UbiE